MFLDKLLKQFDSGYQEEITTAARYHDAAAFLRGQMSALPDAANPSAKEAYEAFLNAEGPAQKQFRILDHQVSSLLQDPEVAEDWYDLVPVWFRVNNRIHEALSQIIKMQISDKTKTIIMESEQAGISNQDTSPEPLPEAVQENKNTPDTEMLLPSDPKPTTQTSYETEVEVISTSSLPSETSSAPAPRRKQMRTEQLSRLNKSGKRAVTLLSGAAGTGKTFRIEERIGYLTDRLQVLPASILMLAQTPEKAQQLGIKYHLELQLPISVACVSEDDALFTSNNTPYTHILLDDLQHFSADQLILMEKLAMRFPDAGWFCTVDDWQAIHGDYQTIYDFRRIFPQCETETLTRVYRHNEELAENAALFVMSDPLHMRKTIKATPCHKPRIHIVAYATQGSVNHFPDAIALATELAGPGSLLLPVHTLQDAGMIGHWFHRPVIPCTPDQLQDAETDGVIIPPSFFVRMHCPILKTDDILSLSATDAEGFASPPPLRLPARERRLLYSALTRSRGCSIILTPLEYQSAFVRELQRLPVKVHTLT